MRKWLCVSRFVVVLDAVRRHGAGAERADHRHPQGSERRRAAGRHGHGARTQETGLTRTAVTDATGEYRLPALPPGPLHASPPSCRASAPRRAPASSS